MNMKDLVTKLALNTSLTQKEAKDAINGIFDIIADAVADGDRVQVPGFGTFYAKVRPARVYSGRFNVEGKETPAKLVAKFNAASKLKNTLAEK